MIGSASPLLFRLRPIAAGDNAFGGMSPFSGSKAPLPALSISISGVSRDSSGVALAGCTCTLFKVATNDALPVFTQMASTVSDGSGNFSFVVGFDGPYRVTFDLDGAQIRAGLTVKTLAGV